MPGINENGEVLTAGSSSSGTGTNVGTISLPFASAAAINTDDVVVDALPYIDSEYDEPGMREMVMALIEDEKKRYRPTKNYLEHMQPLQLHRFETEVMKKEVERMNQRLPMETLSMKRYELPPPPAGKQTDIQAWTECVDNSYAQLEHQATRICNLETMLEYGSESWKMYLEALVSMVRVAQKQLKDVRREIQEINWNRKSNQTAAGEQLKQLESSWVGLVSKNYEIQHACVRLEAEIYEKKAAVAQKQYLLETAELENPQTIPVDEPQPPEISSHSESESPPTTTEG